MQADLVVAGMAERTQEAYLRAVRQLSEYYSGTLPADLTEQQVKDYLLWMRSEKRAAPGTLRIAIGGLRFFYRQTHPVTWKVLDRFRIPKEKKLPNVLTVLEVRRIFHAIRQPRFYTYFWTVYSCGLRLNEALALQIGDIDAERMRIHIHRGKGAKDRFVPLPHATLQVLRWVARPNRRSGGVAAGCCRHALGAADERDSELTPDGEASCASGTQPIGWATRFTGS
jgi:integrase